MDVSRHLLHVYRPIMAIEDRQKEVDAKFGQAFAANSEMVNKRSRNI